MSHIGDENMAQGGSYVQSKGELEEHLNDTIEAIELSAQAFDRGIESEAKRLAAAVRVLVHDTAKSHSLLRQLGKKDIAFLSVSVPMVPENILTYSGIIGVTITPTGSRYVAPLDNIPEGIPRQNLTFDEWWNEVIFKDKNNVETTRKDLILAVANKDGGAHVDPNLNERYANLSRRNSLGWEYKGPLGNLPMPGPQLAAVRQIAHEVMRSLKPEMPILKPDVENIFMGFEANISDTPKQLPPLTTSKKTGRNDPCPCGSGRKYKRCHGRG